MSVGTACLCLVILVLASVIGVLAGAISVEMLGSVQGAGMGGGLLGLGYIIYRVINSALRAGRNAGVTEKGATKS